MSKKIRSIWKKDVAVVGVVLGGLYLIMRVVAKKWVSQDEGRNNPDLDSYEESETLMHNFYADKMKPVLDRIFSFVALLLLIPLFVVISVAIYLDDPGPIFFTQTRIGKDGHFFSLHKFRSMKTTTPHDVPTHQLRDPEQYITRVGRLLRRTSLDELPQIWDIFCGNMSIIGPRPALWNQKDLMAERKKYQADAIRPGLTGLAQICGRDELEISLKAKYDGDYVAALRQGGVQAFCMDVRCFFGTIGCVLKSDGVIEGGTGELQSKKAGSCDAGFEDYGYRKTFCIDTSSHNQKRVLITGAGSYIGESFREWALAHYGKNFTVDTVNMLEDSWRKADFTPYDCVFHVAGIAHTDVGHVSEEEKKRYYSVNTELAIETGKKAKESGVKQFVFMSSMIIYGESAPYRKKKMIDEYTLPAPANFYGDSKWQADKGIRGLNSQDFHVAVLRPPMIYGRGSKGNYPVLAKLAKRMPILPMVENERSMLYIDNLCEFLCKLILSGEGGIYFPQNREYSNTCSLIKEISKVSGKRIISVRPLNLAVILGSHIPGKVGGLVNKAFGNCAYSQKLSIYEGLEYHIKTLSESVRITEGEQL